ncbi:MAG TPA: 16S rRNA (cytosine(1402)-N(4))-methyltransferase RsmH [Candidatus Binatia bacterium]
MAARDSRNSQAPRHDESASAHSEPDSTTRDRLGGHVPVMAAEIVEAIRPRSGRRFVDATVGEGGMAELVLEASSPGGELIGIDWDDAALELSRRRLASFGSRVRLVRDSFANLRVVLADAGWGEGADGIIVDLGVSTLQLGRNERGFSFQADAPLDMRMDRRLPETAADLVATLPERELADVLFRYGEEHASRRIAARIVRRRAEHPVATTRDLRDAVISAGVRTRPGIDPATKTFQALRIAVNRELEQIEALLDKGWELLRPGGRLAILSYHSLEDRIVKRAFATWSADCLCPPRQPVCNCGWSAKVRRVTRSKQKPTEEEKQRNPRARSAGLRVVERLAA